MHTMPTHSRAQLELPFGTTRGSARTPASSPLVVRRPTRVRLCWGSMAWALLLSLCVVLAPCAHAAGVDDEADQWLPRSDGAQWVYAWTNSSYSPEPRIERYRL